MSATFLDRRTLLWLPDENLEAIVEERVEIIGNKEELITLAEEELKKRELKRQKSK